MDRLLFIPMIVNVTNAISFFILLNVRHKTIQSLFTAACKNVCLYFVCIQSAIIFTQSTEKDAQVN